MLINALYVILIIIELKILMEIIMDNAYAKITIMTIIRIVYANYALFNFGLQYFIIHKYNNVILLSLMCSYNANNA